MNIWQELGLGAPTNDLRQIKQAYAARLKQVHPEDDAEGFQRLRAAYETALRVAQARQAVPEAQPATQAPVPAPPPEPRPEPAPPLLQPVQLAPLRQPLPRQPTPAPPGFEAGDHLPRPEPLLVTTLQPAQAAQLLFQQLEAAPPNQWPALLSASRRTPGWENLDFQSALEQAVLNRLLQQYDALEPYLEAVARHYGWQANQMRSRRGESQVEMLLARHKARRRLHDMERSTKARDPRRLRSLHLLRGPVDEARFRAFARWRRNLHSMTALLTQLQSDDQEVWRYELNRASTQWWSSYLANPAFTWDRMLIDLGFGILLGPLLMLVLAASVDAVSGYDLMQHRWLAAPLLLLAMSSLLLQRWVQRLWRRGELSQRLYRWHRHWRHQPRQRRIALGLTTLVLLLCAGAGDIPGFGVFPVLAVLLLWFWTRLGFAVAAAAALAWPLQLQLPLSLLFSRLPVQWPALAHYLDAGVLVIWYPHWLAMFLVLPFNRGCATLYKNLVGEAPQDPLRLGFFSALGLAFVLLIAAGMAGWLDGDGSPPPSILPRRPIQAGPPPPKAPPVTP